MEFEDLRNMTADVQKAVDVECRSVTLAAGGADLSREELFTTTGVVKTSRKGRGNQLQHQYGHLGYCQALGMEPWYLL